MVAAPYGVSTWLIDRKRKPKYKFRGSLVRNLKPVRRRMEHATVVHKKWRHVTITGHVIMIEEKNHGSLLFRAEEWIGREL